jgi:DNA recombination protein RmuC
VILASPTTLMGLLRMAMHGWQQQHMAEEAKHVSGLASDLYGRIVKFAEHMQKVGRNLGTAMNAYNDAVGSLERSVLPGARKFKELHVPTGGKEVPELAPMEHVPRALATNDLPSDDDDDEKETKKA